ncbi:MAG TPA: hypothetical protein VK572_10075 [Burkholderiales bacterium]|nr:hypothetical protein [Burkholderiales bacterium]
MKHSERELRAAANDMAGQLRPRSMLRDASDLLAKFQRDEVFRDYVVSRIWTVIPVVLMFVLVSTVCSIDTMFRVARLVSDSPLWLKGFALLVGAAVWLCGVLAQIYVFLLWLEERAAQKNLSERGVRVEVPAGVLAYLKYSRALPPWILILIFVVLPLGVMARNAPLAALILATLAALAPVLFKKLDS